MPRIRTDLKPFGDQLLVQHADVGQIAVALAEIEPVADHEPVRDLEADVAHRHVDLAPGRLRHQGAHLEARRLPRLQVAHQVREREAGVDDVLDDEHVAAFDVDVEVLEDPDDPGRIGRGAVARDLHEVDLALHREMAHQVGHEEDGALEDADQEQVAALVVGGDLRAELGDPRAQRLLVDEDLADRALELGLAHSSLVAVIPGASTRPGTATTSRPRTTRGHASRSDRGILASTNTSWTFLRRPASRSPGRQLLTLRPGSADSILHGPQRTAPSSATGVCSSQTRSYSRTAVRPPPRSSRFEPVRSARSSSSLEGRRSAARRRFCWAAGWSRSRSGRISSRIRPRLVPGLVESLRYSRPSARQYASVSWRQRGSSGRTIPSSRFGLIAFVVPAETRR